ncbi:MAG: hypothetical protein WC860_01140 [Candidatus Margulisiibacteriota bacterium]|jgi:hypothetical protein
MEKIRSPLLWTNPGPVEHARAKRDSSSSSEKQSLTTVSSSSPLALPSFSAAAVTQTLLLTATIIQVRDIFVEAKTKIPLSVAKEALEKLENNGYNLENDANKLNRAILLEKHITMAHEGENISWETIRNTLKEGPDNITLEFGQVSISDYGNVSLQATGGDGINFLKKLNERGVHLQIVPGLSVKAKDKKEMDIYQLDNSLRVIVDLRALKSEI